MSSSSSDPSRTMMERKKKGAPIKFLVPLIYAPALPLIRLTLRHQPVLRDRLFGLVLAGAFVHGFYLVSLAFKTCIAAFVFLSEDLVDKNIANMQESYKVFVLEMAMS
ncbi:hypothetical protein IGI04_028166 [Brassica rapa subsp. trilocularis]|uniref:Wax synthase domain-containing protein n=1 Tax=Brassica rapa subsp. trilocularis TaxID=1813537 RepID=A0ABQ7L453_BRACM|nr:hypothetical protein IGI04_028166 [Brassica rapa subsp. trilocularis]